MVAALLSIKSQLDPSNLPLL